jgi:hypothetical protein
LFQSIGVAQLQYGGNIVETIEKSRETWHCGRFSFDLREKKEIDIISYRSGSITFFTSPGFQKN